MVEVSDVVKKYVSIQECRLEIHILVLSLHLYMIDPKVHYVLKKY